MVERYDLEKFNFDPDIRELAEKIYLAVDGKIDKTLLSVWVGDIYLFLKQSAIHGKISPVLAKEYQEHFWDFYND